MAMMFIWRATGSMGLVRFYQKFRIVFRVLTSRYIAFGICLLGIACCQPGAAMATETITSVRELRRVPKYLAHKHLKTSYVFGPQADSSATVARIAQRDPRASSYVIGKELASYNQFKKHVEALAKESDVVVFVGHGGPSSYAVKDTVDAIFCRLSANGLVPREIEQAWPDIRTIPNSNHHVARRLVELGKSYGFVAPYEHPEIRLDASVLKSIDFHDAIVVFNGCSTGATVWRKDMMPRFNTLHNGRSSQGWENRRPGTAVSSDLRLIEAAIAANAALAIGVTFPIAEPFDVHALLSDAAGKRINTPAVDRVFELLGDAPNWRRRQGIDSCIRIVEPN